MDFYTHSVQNRPLISLTWIQTLTFIVLTAIYDECSRQRVQIDWWVQCTLLFLLLSLLFLNSRWSRAGPCCPDSCSCGCGPWCDGGTVCPERCSLRRLPWWSPRSDLGVSWGGKEWKKKNNQGEQAHITVLFSRSKTKCHRQHHRRRSRRKKKQRVAFLPFGKGHRPPAGENDI